MKRRIQVVIFTLLAGLSTGFSALGYGTPKTQAVIDSIAGRMLLYQRNNGGWPQPGGNPIDYTKPLTPAQKDRLTTEKNRLDTTIDDGATTREINQLVTAFKTTRNEAYRSAAERGIRYLLAAQQPNGGWGQFYPDSSSYRKQITYNDNAMINVLWVMKHVTDGTNNFDVVDKRLLPDAQKAVDRGIECILNTQVVQHGTLTAWCAQHDRVTLKPTKARAFELPSLSGSESVGIVEFLMAIDHPSARIKKAIRAATAWLDSVKLVGVATKTVADPSQPKGKDVLVVQDPASTIWARFYDLDTNKPFFTGRDSIKKYALADIENERRAGYAWYGTWPARLLSKDYPKWEKKRGNE